MLMTAEDVMRTRLDTMYPRPVPWIGKTLEMDFQPLTMRARAAKALRKAQQELARRQRDYTRLGYEREIMRTPRSDGPTATQIMAAVAIVFQIPSEDLLAKSRKRERVKARHLLAWELRYRKCWSLPRIGDFVGLDHTTITNSLQVVRRNRHGFEDHIKAVALMLDNTGETDDQDHSDSRGLCTDDHQCAC